MKNDIVYKLQDLTKLDWNHSNPGSSGTGGWYYKASEHLGTRRIFYKLSDFEPYRGRFGCESVNELIASRFLDILGIEHVSYRLIWGTVCVQGKKYDTWVCASRNFLKSGEEKTSLEHYYELFSSEHESPEDFCIRMGWQETIEKMLLVDYLICNRDRHGANIEVITGGNKEPRLAPLFDHGSAFLPSTSFTEAAIRGFDVMEDWRGNNYLYSKSLSYNLRFVSEELKVTPLRDNDKAILLRGLDKVLPDYHLDKIWELVYRRWQHYESL